MFKKLVIVCGCLLFCSPWGMADSLQDFRRSMEGGVHRSLSGQFITRNAPSLGQREIDLNHTTNFVRLEPEFVGISCERIKSALLGRLGSRDQWKDQIYLELHHAEQVNETVVVTSVLMDKTWVYRIQLPDALDKYQFVSAVTSTLLLEMANRHAGRSAELPLWLIEGLASELVYSSPTALVLEPPQMSPNGFFLSRRLRDNRRANSLMSAHENLQAALPLSIEDLSWPNAGQLDGEAGGVYRSSAQLFVDRLLQLRDGPAAMQNFVTELPGHLNWQLTFLQAFHADFSSQLMVDKWWALQLSDFTGRDLTSLWDGLESWIKLDEILHPMVEVQTGPNDQPFRTQVTLERVITDWSHLRQDTLLNEKIRQLAIVRYHVAPEFGPVIDAYQRTLRDYLKHRDGLAFNPDNRNLYSPPTESMADATIRSLRALDARRQLLRPKAPLPTTITAN